MVDALRETVPDDAVVTVDSGAHRILLSQRWAARRPLELLQSAGLCTMAAALPLAIGAKLAAPERPVVAVVGDGGLEMGLGELATLRDLALPIVVVVFQDHSLALIDLKQHQAGYPRTGVTLGATRFEIVAEAFGGRGARVTDRRSFVATLDEGLAARSFTLVACEIDAGQYVGRL